MNVTSEKTGPCEYTLTIEVEPTRAKKTLEKTAREITRRNPIPGFRPGKAPYNIIEGYFGKEVIYSRALDELGSDVYQDALNEAGLEPYAQGTLDMAEMEPLILKAVVPVQPVIELGDYRSIRQEKPEIPFAEEDIDETIEQLREQHAEWNPVERAVQDGDQVVIDLNGTAGEEQILSQSSRRTFVMEHMYPEGLYEHALGLEPEQSVEYEVTFDEENPNPNFAGKTVTFGLKVLSVSEKALPEIDVEFSKKVANAESVEELRASIREKLFDSRREEVRDELASNILLAILENATLEYPDVAVDEEVERQVRDVKQSLQRQGFSWEVYLNLQKKSEEEYREEIRPAAEQRLRESLALSRVAELENMPVSDEQINGEIDRLIAPYGPNGESIREFFASEPMLSDVVRRVRIANTVEWLIDMATGELDRNEAAQEPEADASEAEQAETTEEEQA